MSKTPQTLAPSAIPLLRPPTPASQSATDGGLVRPFAVKGRKRKHKEKYDAESREDGRQRNQKELKLDEEEEGRDGVSESQSRQEDETKGEEELEGIPILPSQNGVEKRTGVTFVLERASLEVAKVGKSYQLLNSDDHANFLKKNGRNPADYTPDIVHQVLLAILDSPLNKAGKVRAVYVRTEKGVLFEVKPHVQIPRTYKRFSGIMLQLLQKLSITASGKREKQLRVIKNPVTQYFPVNARRIGFSHSSEKLVEVQDYVASVNDETPLFFVVGALAHGKIEAEYTDDFIAIFTYPLSAACCINM